MNPSDNNLRRILSLARKAQPKPEEAVSENDVRFFAQRIAAVWSRGEPRQAPLDGWRLWERIGVWSLATAAAMVLLAAIYQPQPPAANAFDPLGPDALVEEPLFF